MDANRFDQMTRLVAVRRHSRRAALRAGSAGLVGTLLAALGSRVLAQGTPPVGGGEMAANNATLFVQTAASGSFSPNPPTSPTLSAAGAMPAGGRGAYVLTLHGHAGETIAFSDRPQRNFGEVKTSQFFTSMGFTPANPPNAALVATTAQQAETVLLLELLNPGYDDGTKTLTYEANLLQKYPNDRGDALAPLAAKQRSRTIAPEFGSASLFIDDCPDLTTCHVPDGGACSCQIIGPLPAEPLGQCWH